MPFCYICGLPLTFEDENFCPKCGTNLRQKVATVDDERENNNHPIDIHDNPGAVFGVGFAGSGNIMGERVGYTVNGPILNFNGDHFSNEVLDKLQKILSKQVEHLPEENIKSDKDFESKVEESNTAHQQIKNVLDEVSKIENESKTDIKEIKVEEL